MHRFVWPLRYAAPAVLTGGRRAGGDGVWAPPGHYTVVLTVDGTRLSQPLTVTPDPRVKTSPEGYARQFALARRIEEVQARVATALQELGEAQKGLAERRAKAAPQAAKEIDALLERIRAISGGDTDFPPPTDWKSLRALNLALGRLAGAVDNTDDPPTPDAAAGFEKLLPAVDQALAAWEGVKAKVRLRP
jgi:hypothetical protein